jgi:DNA-binding MarR family transcriptional regulator
MNHPQQDPASPALVHKGSETHLLKEIMLIHQGIINVFTRKVGMPGARFHLLRQLAISDGEDLGPMDLARRLGVNAAAVTRQLKEMEAQGLVERRGDSRDARRSYVRLSDKGREMFRTLHERAHGFEQSLNRSISDVDMATAVRVLSEVRQALAALL